MLATDWLGDALFDKAISVFRDAMLATAWLRHDHFGVRACLSYHPTRYVPQKTTPGDKNKTQLKLRVNLSSEFVKYDSPWGGTPSKLNKNKSPGVVSYDKKHGQYHCRPKM